MNFRNMFLSLSSMLITYITVFKLLFFLFLSSDYVICVGHQMNIEKMKMNSLNDSSTLKASVYYYLFRLMETTGNVQLASLHYISLDYITQVSAIHLYLKKNPPHSAADCVFLLECFQINLSSFRAQ